MTENNSSIERVKEEYKRLLRRQEIQRRKWLKSLRKSLRN